MSFSKLEAIGAARNNPTGVTASIWGRRGGALRLSLSFSAACLRSLSVDDPFAIGWRVFVGEGDDFGRLKLAVDSDGEFRLTRSKNGVARLHLGPVAWIADARQKPCPCKVVAEDSLSLMIELPVRLLGRSTSSVASPASADRAGVPPPRPARRGLGSY